MNDLGFLGSIVGIAVTASLFLASYFIIVKTKDEFENKLLGYLFVAIGLRLAKSIMFFIFHSLAPFGLAIGFLALASIGPLLFLYLRATKRGINNFKKSDYLHLVIPLAGTPVVLLTNLNIATLSYWTATGGLLIYIIVTILKHVDGFYTDDAIKKWNTKVIWSVAVVWAAFVFQHASDGIMNYALGAAMASLAIYYIFIIALKSPVVFNSGTNKPIPDDVIDKVRISFEEDNVHRIPGMTLSKFSEEQNIPAYLVTKSVKELYHKSFPETINYFRIEEIKNLLHNEVNDTAKIETLAYEVGFKSPSAFYSEFKKITGSSPKEFKEAKITGG